jgi:NAD(P)-dependent dehydrogenase (short-subunit alcohol dehydrogenase family)
MTRDRLQSLGRKTAVITGGGSGLGRALALNLARDGWRVGLADVDVAGAECTLDLVEKAGGSGEVLACDIRDAEQVAAMARHFFDAFGGVSLLVNNAGIAVAGFVGEAEISEWRRIVDVNVMGTVNCCHAFIPPMKERGAGYIINVASAAGISNLPEMAPYNMTKAAVISLSETLRTELVCDGIGVTVACPTFFDTHLVDDMSCTNEFQSEFARSAFSNAKVTPDDVAAAIITGARKGKLYVLPQFAAKWTTAAKRISPAGWYGTLALGYRLGIARPIVMWLARHGGV